MSTPVNKTLLAAVVVAVPTAVLAVTVRRLTDLAADAFSVWRTSSSYPIADDEHAWAAADRVEPQRPGDWPTLEHLQDQRPDPAPRRTPFLGLLLGVASAGLVAGGLVALGWWLR